MVLHQQQKETQQKGGGETQILHAGVDLRKALYGRKMSPTPANVME
jgi:hypothetical protein